MTPLENDEMNEELIPTADSEKHVDWSSIVEDEDGEDTGWRIQVMNGTGSVTEVAAATEMAHILNMLHSKCIEDGRDMTRDDFRQALTEMNWGTMRDVSTLTDTIRDLSERTETARTITELFSAEKLAKTLGIPVEYLTYNEMSLAHGMGVLQALTSRYGNPHRHESVPENTDIQDLSSEEQ